MTFFDSIASFFKGVGNSVTGIFSDIGDTLKEIPNDAFHTIDNTVNSVTGTVSNITSEVGGIAKGFEITLFLPLILIGLGAFFFLSHQESSTVSNVAASASKAPIPF